MTNGTISIPLTNNLAMQEVQQSQQQPAQTDLLKNDEPFPTMDLKDFRQQMRLDGTVTEPRLKEALTEAMYSVNDELRNLADKTHTFSKKSAQFRYKRAVYCLALANLQERYANYDLTNDGEKKMDMLQDSIDRLRRDARYAIADIKGKARIITELI